MTDVGYIIVHCSDSPDDRDISAETIHSWHLERGFDGIGYHYVIKRSGAIENGRPEYWSGAHCRGYNNTSIGVCLVGNSDFDDAQFDSLNMLLGELKDRYPSAVILGHCDIDPNKTCPNFNVSGWIAENKIRV